MTLPELILLAIALSMDAFAVSVCKGLSLRKPRLRDMAIIGLYFGVAQAVMPAIGYVLGSAFSALVSAFAPWIAFVLLAAIGAKMLWETFHGGDEEANAAITALDHKELFLLAIATSIDALAVGVTFAFLDVALLPSVTLIGCTTFLLSAIGMKLGSVFGDKYEKKANILGGVILICLGVKILLEHLLG
jgi:putative Mn2+ efflux pump MntP